MILVKVFPVFFVDFRSPGHLFEVPGAPFLRSWGGLGHLCTPQLEKGVPRTTFYRFFVDSGPPLGSLWTTFSVLLGHIFLDVFLGSSRGDFFTVLGSIFVTF